MSNESKPAYITLLLAVLHATAGLSILVISSWFIAISAIAPVGFNYVIPAVVIRGLALLRIASGYASMWVGHKDLLGRITAVRMGVFSQLQNCQLDDKASSTEALAQHTEVLASKWIAWVSPLSSVLFIFSMTCLIALWTSLLGAIYLIVLYCVWIILLIFQWLSALVIAQQNTAATSAFRRNSSQFLAASPIWHLNKKRAAENAPSATLVWRQQLGQKKKTIHTMWMFQGIAFVLTLLLMAGVLPFAEIPVFAPIGLIVPMLLLAAPDWVSASFSAVANAAQHQQSKSALSRLKTSPIHQLVEKPILTSLQLNHFAARNRTTLSVTDNLPAKGVVAISGVSGCGKSSLLQAIAGLLPAEGERKVDGYAIPEGLVKRWVYVEQDPIILSGSVKMNLDPAGCHIAQENMCELLAVLGLDTILPLTNWVGKSGRQLSGGERKRLALARAVLANPIVLMVDEPFEGLDIQTQEQVCAVLEKEAESRLVIVASHVLPATLPIDKHIALKEANIENVKQHRQQLA
jgi:ATP-binding cassette subfamily C protein CydC